jgi:type IV secretory pathway VirB10-like protein
MGQCHSANLLYDNQRLPTMSTTLTFLDGRSVLLEESPVMDQQGTAGLVSAVDNHWWRNLGAVLIQGVLRG